LPIGPHGGHPFSLRINQVFSHLRSWTFIQHHILQTCARILIDTLSMLPARRGCACGREQVHVPTRSTKCFNYSIVNPEHRSDSSAPACFAFQMTARVKLGRHVEDPVPHARAPSLGPRALLVGKIMQGGSYEQVQSTFSSSPLVANIPKWSRELGRSCMYDGRYVEPYGCVLVCPFFFFLGLRKHYRNGARRRRPSSTPTAPKVVCLCARFSFFSAYANTTGMVQGADGHLLRRRSKVGAVDVEGLQDTPPRWPLAYECPRCSPRYADGYPRRIEAVGVATGHVSLLVRGRPAL
jgi:hypothetical protein